MQLGELQSQLKRFNKRGVEVLALSVDPLKESRSLIRRLKLGFSIVSDEDQKVMKAYGVQNPETQALALHAVYILDKNREVFYRKVAGRRPRSQELLDAIDYQMGRYPLGDKAIASEDFVVAYPVNIFQTIISLARVDQLPSSMKAEDFVDTVSLLRQGESDETIIALRKVYQHAAPERSEAELLQSAAWITNKALEMDNEALETGRQLSETLSRIRNLRSQKAIDQAALLKQRKRLDEIRSKIQFKQSDWNLQYAKAMLRGFRELAIAAKQK